MNKRARAVLRPGKERLPRLHHPWVFSGAIGRIEGTVEKGDIIRVCDSRESFVAWGFYNPDSSTSIRLVEWTEAAEPDEGWWYGRVARAFEARGSLLQSEGFRAVYGEADGIPGLVVDIYDEFAVVQCTTAAVEQRKDVIAGAIRAACEGTGRALAGIYERSESDVRKLEKLPPTSGTLWGSEPPDPLFINDAGVRVGCSLRSGQKGGYYFDQRDNRARVASYSPGKRLLDAFCYTGGFSLQALSYGATHVTLVDSSADALRLAERDLVENGFGRDRWEIEEGDVFRTLRAYRDAGRVFDIVILDPPKLATSRAAVDDALRGYKDLNLQALRVLTPGGILATFSCSGRVSREQFRTAVAWAAKDAGRDARIIETLSQAADHPVPLSFPEAEYLKGYILQVP